MTDALVRALTAALGARGVLTEAHDLQRYEQGWRYGSGRARCVARPATTAEVAVVLRLCGEHGARVVAQGANTGLVAASTPDGSGEMVVMGLERRDRAIEVDAQDRVAVVDAGVRLSALNERLAEHGLWFPVDLGADPQIGGMVATNTGGTRLLRYGDVRRNLLGLEVVLGDGRVVSLLDRLRKNNTGLDAKQLFVGTTGVLGVVTKAVLSVAPRPAQAATALVGCRDGDAVLQVLDAVERAAGDLLSAFEVMGDRSIEAALRHQPTLRQPFADLPRFAALIELSSALPAAALSLEGVLEECLAGHLDRAPTDVTEVLVGDAGAAWRLRHSLSESLRNDGELVAFDVSVARSRLPALTERTEALLEERFPGVRLCDYGHWGDGGSHLNLLWERGDVGDAGARKRALQDEVYALVVREFGGSFSAEHGVGPHNQRFYDRYTAAPIKQLSGALKRFCDPDDRLGTAQLG